MSKRAILKEHRECLIVKLPDPEAATALWVYCKEAGFPKRTPVFQDRLDPTLTTFFLFGELMGGGADQMITGWLEDHGWAIDRSS